MPLVRRCNGPTLVSSHQDMGSLLEMLAEEVAKSVVFLEQDEVRGVGHACLVSVSADSIIEGRVGFPSSSIPAKGFSVIFFSPADSSSKKSSNLQIMLAS